MSVTPRNGPLGGDKLHFREGGKWILIRAWLIELADDSILYKRTPAGVKHFWYKRGRKGLHLLDLPPEL